MAQVDTADNFALLGMFTRHFLSSWTSSAIQYFLAAAQSGSLSAALRSAGRDLAGRRETGQRTGAELGASCSSGAAAVATHRRWRAVRRGLRAVAGAVAGGRRRAAAGGSGRRARWSWGHFHSCFNTASCRRCRPSMRAIRISRWTFAPCCTSRSRPRRLDRDLLLLHGWFEAGAWVRRELPVAQVTTATSDYWKRRAFLHPRDLADHICLSYRIPTAKLLDLWLPADGAAGRGRRRGGGSGWLNSTTATTCWR